MAAERGAGEDEQGASDVFVLRPSRRKIAWDMAAMAISAVGVVWLLATRDTQSLITDIVLLGVFPVLVAVEIRLWRRVLSTDALMEVTPSGLRIDHLGRGWATLPWDAVGLVTSDWARAVTGGVVVVRPAPGVDASTPGVVLPAEGLARRWTLWRGFRVPTYLGDARAIEVLTTIGRTRRAHG